MSTDVLDERARHVALVRAQASLIVDAARPLPRLSISAGTRLRSSPRKRFHARRPQKAAPPAPRRRSPARRRLIAIAALGVQLALLGLALTLPAFQVRRVTVAGAHLVTTSAVVAAARVPEESIFSINGAAIQSRVLALPWVASAVVTTQLPATVRINIVERAPVLRVRRNGTDTLIAANGATLPGIDATPSARSGIPVLIDDRAGSPQPLNPELVQMLGTIAERFPAVFGCSVAAYLWGSDDVVSLWASTGWRAVLGPLDTELALRGLPNQIETMAALKGHLNYARPAFGYLDIESPADPVSGGKPGLPAEVVAALLPVAPDVQPPPAASSVPPPTPQPTPTLKPSPTPSPTPVAVTVGPTPRPSPTPSAAH